MLAVLVTGVSWYAGADREVYLLPSETVVGLPRVLAAMAGGRLAHLLLPEGVVSLPRRALPLQPRPIEQVYPLGAAEIPWDPDPRRWALGDEVPVLGHGWQFLFRERRAFSPWGGEEDLPLLEAFQRAFGPRARFRESHDRRSIGVKFPQLVDPRLAYRLNEHAQALPDPARFAAVMAVQEGVRLSELEHGRVAVFGPGQLGWRVRVFASAEDAAIGREADATHPRDPDQLAAFLARHGRFWRLEPLRREVRLVLPG